MLLAGDGLSPEPLRTLCALAPKDARDFAMRCAALGERWTARQREARLEAELAGLRHARDVAARREHDLTGAALRLGRTAAVLWRAARSPRLHPREGILGEDLPAATLFPVAVGFAIRATPIPALLRALDSATVALQAIGQHRRGSLLVADDGARVDPAGLVPWAVTCLPRSGTPGFAAAHNAMMTAAFADGAEVYVAAHPGGTFAPDALVALLRMVRAGERKILVDATRAPRPLDRPVDPADLGVPWVSGGCLAIPRQVHAAIGGFDEELVAWGADLDLSWRARAAGIAVRTCPRARFRLPVSDRDREMTPAVRAAAAVLAARWGREPDLALYPRDPW
jgi:hypothetical protein